MPPARRTDENCIIFRQCLFIKQIRYSRAQVIIGFMLNAVAVIVRICSIRFGSLNAMDICVGQGGTYFSSSFSSSSTAAFSCVSSPFTMVSGELATLMSGSSCEFSR